MTILLALDPGNTESAWLLYDTATGRPTSWAKEPNADLLLAISGIDADEIVIEMVASYGMAVGAEIFDTCVWIGRFLERWDPTPHRLIYRPDVKLHLTQTRRAKDANIRQALIDRFGGSAAIGRKAAPGPLYGISRDVWSALAIAVTYTLGREGVEAA